MLYKKITLALFLLLTVSVYAQSPSNMFLGTPTHLPEKNEIRDDCFDKLSWKYNAGSAIRSTPVTDINNIYFGTEKGDFFCVDRATAKTIWKFSAPFPIHSSPAIQNKLVFFSDAKQTLYALSASTGKVNWQVSLGVNKIYDWKFDFFWSSPTISGDSLFIGSGDGNLYAVSAATGKIYWRFSATAHIRCAPAVFYGMVYFGDMNGYFYAVNSRTGKLEWKYETNGVKFVNDSFGYDRKGILAAPVITGNNIVFGARDGFMYNLDPKNGRSNWIFDYHITWVVSSVATDGKIVYAGTSDGKYVNAIDLQTGKELWRSPTNIVWSSPLLINSKLYVGGYDGFLYCINKNTGAKMNTPLFTAGRVQSSPVLAGKQLFIGSDDGNMYALQSGGSCKEDPATFIKYVFYERDAPRLYYRNGADILLRSSLANTGFKQIDSKALEDLFKKDVPADSNIVVVFASNYFPATVMMNGKNSLLREFLNKGGRILVTGLNPVVYNIDTATKEISSDFTKMKGILDIDLKYTDTRAHGGILYCEATPQGLDAGLPGWWMAPFPVTKDQVDIILGENINKDASAYVKKYSQKPNSGLIQLWIDADFIPADINFVRKVALADF